MPMRATLGALLLITVGVVLGATVFRSDIAQATGLAQSVTVNNTPAQAVPVREQNLDGSNIRVHEEGTANVNVTNSSLPDAAPSPITGGGSNAGGSCGGAIVLGAVATASALTIHMDSGVASVQLFRGSDIPAMFTGPGSGGSADIALALTRPVEFDKVSCVGSGLFTVSWVGNSP